MSKPKRAKYYKVDMRLTHGGAGYEILNYDTLQENASGVRAKSPWPQGYLELPNGPWRFPPYVEKPQILFDRRLGHAPRDIECIDGFWIVSRAFKDVIDAVAPDAGEYRECETVLASGEPGPERWLFSITRVFLGAIDIDRSENLYVRQVSEGKIGLGVQSQTKVQFHSGVIGEAHLFRIAESGRFICCDHAFKTACQSAKLKGLEFQQITK